jgi:S-DNA-T family DNA segregation ATPase FtsK/SpoIIIE
VHVNVTVESSGVASDVIVEADESAAASALADALAPVLGAPCSSLAVVPKPGVAVPSADGTVASLGLRHGMRLGVNGVTPSLPTIPKEGLQLHVVGGPNSGMVFSLPLGVHDIGRSTTVSWPEDRLLSRRHASVTVTEQAVTLTDLGSSNGTFLDGRRLDADETATIEPGATISVGEALLEVRPARDASAAVEFGQPGWLNFLRPPRIRADQTLPQVEVPRAPDEPSKRRFPVLAMLAPLIMGVVMVIVMKNVMYALFMLLSPIMLIFNFISDKQGGRADHKKKVADYHEGLAKAQQVLTDGVKQEKAQLRTDWPDAADTLLTCLLPGPRLWERRRGDPDSLAIRLGTADIDSTIKVTGATEGADHKLASVPVGVTLFSHPIVGLAGPSRLADGALRWAITQLAAYHPTRDMTCSFVGLGAGLDWDWLQWLPHMRPEPGEDGPIAYVFTTDKSIGDHLTALAAMVDSRQEVLRHRSGGRGIAFTSHVLFVREYHEIRYVAGLGTVLSDGPQVGVFVICTDAQERTLPEECAATLVFDDDGSAYARLQRRGDSVVSHVLGEGVSSQWCDRAARELSPLIDTGADGQDATLPASSRLLEVIGLDPPNPDAIGRIWAAGGRTTKAMIGEAIDGPFTIDISKDGPHGLVAGTTGSGKSELLQTVVASLAVGNRPDEMNFVLIDYKGGAAFKDCAHLPHTVGMVSDLDGHLTNRALESLSAELHRREHQLARAGAKDIEDYLESKTDTDEPMARLLIIIDEFAAMVQELPDFVAGLIDITRRGRSLGTHLILATQRPAGVVSAEIKSNTNLRVALRVTDVEDSSDVIDAPDSAHIPKSLPGRAYARLGHSSLIAFQAARVGGRPPGAVVETTAQAWAYGFNDLCSAPPVNEAGETTATTPTDLANLVTAVRQTAVAMGIPDPPSPWLPALDEAITVDEIIAQFPQACPGADHLLLPLGMTDMPSQQRRDVSAVDLVNGSHLAIIGAPRSGRSSALRVVGASIGRWLSPDDVHVYCVDCGNNALLPFHDLPHVGAVVTRDQSERLDRLTRLLQRLISSRQQQLAASGFADVTEQREASSPGGGLPYVVVLFDGWEGFFQAYDNYDGGRLVASWQQILQEGASVGVRVIMTGDRTLLSGRIASLFADKLMLRMIDPADFGAVGMRAKDVPESFPSGRGFRALGLVETQIALVAEDPSGAAQVASVQQTCRDARLAWADVPQNRRPGRVDVLPTRFAMSQMSQVAPVEWTPTLIPVAVGGDTLSVRSLDAIDHGPAILVAGPRRSGRSTTLCTMGTFAADRGWRLVIVTPRISPLRSLDGGGTVVASVGLDADREHFTGLLKQLRADSRPSMVLVDDVELIGQDEWLGTVLADHIIAIRDTGSVLVGAGAIDEIGRFYSGPAVHLKKARSGIMLSPQTPQDSDLFGVAAMQRSSYGQTLPPGAGYLVRASMAERVQVIWPGE